MCDNLTLVSQGAGTSFIPLNLQIKYFWLGIPDLNLFLSLLVACIRGFDRGRWLFSRQKQKCSRKVSLLRGSLGRFTI